MTHFDILVPVSTNSTRREARFSNLDSAVEHVKWMMRHDPDTPIRLEILPPSTQEPR